MSKWNKFIASAIALLAAGLAGDDADAAALVDVFPAEWRPYFVASIPILIAAFPNGRPFWQITKPSVGANV